MVGQNTRQCNFYKKSYFEHQNTYKHMRKNGYKTKILDKVVSTNNQLIMTYST